MIDTTDINQTDNLSRKDQEEGCLGSSVETEVTTPGAQIVLIINILLLQSGCGDLIRVFLLKELELVLSHH